MKKEQKQTPPKPKLGRPPKGKTAKKTYQVYLEEAHKEAIIEKHGSLTAAIETTAPNPNASPLRRRGKDKK